MWVPEDVPSKSFRERCCNNNEAQAATMEASGQARPYTLIYYHNNECNCIASYNLHKLRGLI